MIELTDDGTLDTVLRCSECGEEMRYNYSAESDDDDRRADFERDYKARHPRATPEECIDAADSRLYDDFVDWAIQDAIDDHECGQEDS